MENGLNIFPIIAFYWVVQLEACVCNQIGFHKVAFS